MATNPKAKSCLFNQMYEFRRYNPLLLYSEIYPGCGNFQIVTGTRLGGKFTSLQDAIGGSSNSAIIELPNIDTNLFSPVSKKTIIDLIHSFIGISVIYNQDWAYVFKSTPFEETFTNIYNSSIQMDYSSKRIVESNNLQKRVSGSLNTHYGLVIGYDASNINIITVEVFNVNDQFQNEFYNNGYQISSDKFLVGKFIKNRMQQVDPITTALLDADGSYSYFFGVASEVKLVTNPSQSLSSSMGEINASTTFNTSSQSAIGGEKISSGIATEIQIYRTIIQIDMDFYVIYNIDTLRLGPNTNTYPKPFTCLKDSLLFDEAPLYNIVDYPVQNFGSFRIKQLSTTNFSSSTKTEERNLYANVTFNLEIDKLEFSDFSPDYNYPTVLG